MSEVFCDKGKQNRCGGGPGLAGSAIIIPTTTIGNKKEKIKRFLSLIQLTFDGQE